MKTLNSTSLLEQKKIGELPNVIEKIILYEQYISCPIAYVNATNSIEITGDLTSDLSVGDKVICAIKDFVTELTITVIADIGGGRTGIEFSSGSFTSDDVGKHIAKRINITRKIIKNGIGDVSQKIEGESLSDFDSGSLSVILDNDEGYFHSSSKTGILNSENVFWAKYQIGFKTADDVIDYFAGLVDLTDFSPNLYDKTVKIKIHGHTKELERYPAFYVSDENENNLPTVPAITIVNYTESDSSEEGIKKIKYKPFTTSKLKGIEIKSVSNDTDEGIKVLEFRYPHFFKWDNGDWNSVATTSDVDSNGDVKVYAKGGSGNSLFAIINFGSSSTLNEFPDIDCEMWVEIKNESEYSSKKEIGNSGKPILQFDNGIKHTIRLHFQRVLEYDDSGGTYTEVSDDCNVDYELDGSSETILADTDDLLILVSQERFWGIEFLLGTPFTTGSIQVLYSTGGDTFSSAMTLGTNGLVDGTSNLTQSGKITWNTILDWKPNNFKTDGSDDETHYSGFMIAIKRVSATGACVVNEIKQMLRLQGENEDFLEVNLVQAKLSGEDGEDEIVLKYENEAWSFGTWYQNLSLHELLTLTLDKSNYGSSKRTLSEIKITGSTYYFNIWGKSPSHTYPFSPSAIYYDSTNEYVYLGVKNELWRCSRTGRWEHLYTVWLSPANKKIIRKIWKNGNLIYFILMSEYTKDDNLGYFYSHIEFGTYNISSEVYTRINDPSSYGSGFCDGEHYIRNGKDISVGSPPAPGGTIWYRRIVGKIRISYFMEGGENLCIPFRQLITPAWDAGKDLQNNLCAARTLTGNCDIDGSLLGGIGTGFIMRFDTTEAAKIKEYYDVNAGYWALDSLVDQTNTTGPSDRMRMRFSFGQQGAWFVNRQHDEIFALHQELGTPTGFWCKMQGWTDSGTYVDKYHRLCYADRDHLPVCIAEDDEEDELYLGSTPWNDSDDPDTAFTYSYITRFGNTRIKDWDAVYWEDTGYFVDITSSANNNDYGMNAAPLDAVDDAWYFGMTNDKFRTAFINPDGDDIGTLIFEYYNGSSWVALEGVMDWNGGDNDYNVSWKIPSDWAKTTIDYNSCYWIRVRCSSYSSGTMYLDAAWLLEYVVWDSELDNSGAYQYYSPIALCFNPNEGTIHGCMFNRNSSGAGAFQWIYFVYRISSETVYFQSTGNNFTFDGTMLLKEFRHDDVNNESYCIAEDIRHKEKSSFLIKGVYSSGTITLTKIGTPKIGEWGCKQMEIADDGTIFGITQNNKHTVWEYSNSFYPRIELAKFGKTETIKNILKNLSLINNSMMFINSNRNIRFTKRNTYNGTFSLKWNETLVKNKRIKFGYWDHYYDSVQVDWESIFDEESGDKKLGFTGWMKKTLSLSNSLIQSPHLAQVIVDQAYEFFNSWRYTPKEVKTLFLIQLECTDRFNLIIPSSILDFNLSNYFLITELKLSSRNKNLTIKGLELL